MRMGSIRRQWGLILRHVYYVCGLFPGVAGRMSLYGEPGCGHSGEVTGDCRRSSVGIILGIDFVIIVEVKDVVYEILKNQTFK